MSRFQHVPFPNPLAPKKEKDDEKFGKAVLRAIMGATQEYRERRDKRVSLCREFAKGDQPIQPYLDQLTDDGKSSWNNIIYRPRPIASKFEEIVVNGYMEQREYPKVTAMSKHVQDRKNRKRDEARFRMEYQDLIGQLTQSSEIPPEDPSAFVPRSMEELDIWYKLNEKEVEEILMQRMLTFTAEDIDIDYLKQQVLSEQFQAGVHGFYDYLDNNSRFNCDFIQAEDCIYDTFMGEKSKGMSYAGRLMRMTITDIRSRWGLSAQKEEELFAAACQYRGRLGNPAHRLEWKQSYINSQTRPYDNFTVEIAHVWWRCSKVINYIEGKDRYGREVFQTLPDGVEITKLSGNKYAGKVIPQTAYEGYFIATEKATVLEWGEARNLLRKGEDKEELLCPFEFRIPGNKGDMMPNSPVYKIIPDLMEMDILELKIKTAIARSAPSGYAIDISSIVDVDLGEGVGIADPVTLTDIYRNTGWLYYRSRGDDGERQNQPPIQVQQQGFDPQISGFLELYNWRRNEIRETLGINEFRDGSASSPRIGYRYAQAQLSQSNTATLGLYRAWLTSGQEIYRHAAIRIWDSLAYGTPNKGYLKYLGKKDADFIRKSKEITSSSYDIKFEMGMTLQDREELEQNIQTCLAAGTLEMVDAIAIRDIDDIQLANQVLSWRYELRRQEREESATRQSRMAAEANAQAGQAVEQAKQQTAMVLAQAEMAKEQQRGRDDQIQELIKGAMSIIEESFKTGKPIPPEYQPFVQLAIDSAATQAAKSTNDTQQQMLMEQMQQQMAAQEVVQ